mmetsp:Transcript_8071/g.35885  ORF Transcript_8071/g.35885 Transcript_8071/m.35885 type:complete len:80 (-) Transcript_8071:642-881(-)
MRWRLLTLVSIRFPQVCKYVKSNAIVFAKDGSTVGQGAGQMSRVDSARIAALKAKETSEAAQVWISPRVSSCEISIRTY